MLAECNPYCERDREFDWVDLLLLNDAWAILCKTLTAALIALFAITMIHIYVTPIWFDIIRSFSN